MDWRKSSHSGANGGSCVEVAGTARVVLVRDTTDRDGQTLAFSAEARHAFAEDLKRLASAWKRPARTEYPLTRGPLAMSQAHHGAGRRDAHRLRITGCRRTAACCRCSGTRV